MHKPIGVPEKRSVGFLVSMESFAAIIKNKVYIVISPGRCIDLSHSAKWIHTHRLAFLSASMESAVVLSDDPPKQPPAHKHS